MNGYWTVRKGITNPDGTMVWSTVDSFAPGYNAAQAVFCHPTAGVFAAGDVTVTVTKGNKTTTYRTWTVRRSRDGGATWATVDAFPANNTLGIGADPAGNIYVVGQSSDENWLVRKSSDGGTSWATADSWRPSNHSGVQAAGIAADSSGNVFVFGYSGPSPIGWIVRESRAGTGTWQTVDNLTYGVGATANAIVADDSGNVVVAGFGTTKTNDGLVVQHWIVRKLMP